MHQLAALYPENAIGPHVHSSQSSLQEQVCAQGRSQAHVYYLKMPAMGLTADGRVYSQSKYAVPTQRTCARLASWVWAW